MPSNDFAPFQKKCTVFIVKNITPDEKKTIRIFHYPINYGETRDILALRGVSESDIRASMLKGELNHKFLAGDIQLIYSNIDLLQFSDCNLEWLKSLGFTDGVEISVNELGNDVINYIDTHGGSNLNYVWREKIPLIGMRNGVNRTFYTPEKFINGSYFGNVFHLTVEHNGKELYENIDYSIGESGGAGTGYDTINIFSLTPNSHSLLYATYVVAVSGGSGGGGGSSTPIITKITSSHLVVNTEDIIVIIANTGGITVTLPIAPNTGDDFYIKDDVGNSSINPITISGNGNDIDGISAYILNSDWSSVYVVFNGTEWNIL